MFVKDWGCYLDDAAREVKKELAKPDASDASLFSEWIVAAFDGMATPAAAKIVQMALAGDLGIELRNRMNAELMAEIETRALAAETDDLVAA